MCAEIPENILFGKRVSIQSEAFQACPGTHTHTRINSKFRNKNNSNYVDVVLLLCRKVCVSTIRLMSKTKQKKNRKHKLHRTPSPRSNNESRKRNWNFLTKRYTQHKSFVTHSWVSVYMCVRPQCGFCKHTFQVFVSILLTIKCSSTM